MHGAGKTLVVSHVINLENVDSHDRVLVQLHGGLETDSSAFWSYQSNFAFKRGGISPDGTVEGGGTTWVDHLVGKVDDSWWGHCFAVRRIEEAFSADAFLAWPQEAVTVVGVLALACLTAIPAVAILRTSLRFLTVESTPTRSTTTFANPQETVTSFSAVSTVALFPTVDTKSSFGAITVLYAAIFPTGFWICGVAPGFVRIGGSATIVLGIVCLLWEVLLSVFVEMWGAHRPPLARIHGLGVLQSAHVLQLLAVVVARVREQTSRTPGAVPTTSSAGTRGLVADGIVTTLTMELTLVTKTAVWTSLEDPSITIGIAQDR